MSIGKRIKEIRKVKGIGQVKLSKLVGSTQAAISRYENDQQYPGGEFLSKMVESLGINLNWLLTGEGSMYQELEEVDGSVLDDLLRLPIAAEIAAGEPCEVVLDEPIGFISFPRRLLQFPPPYHVFRVKGRSMEPHILSGDIVICSKDWRGVSLDGKIMAFRTVDGITLKRLVEDGKNRVTWLMPINHEFTPVPYIEDGEEVRMIGILDVAIRGYNRG